MSASNLQPPVMRLLPRRAKGVAGTLLLSAFLLSALGLSGCSGEGELPPGYDGDGTRNGAGLLGPCEEGAERSCHEQLSLENGILTCWNGTQFCEDGHWGDCVDGEVSEMPAPKETSLRPRAEALSLSGDPEECGAFNPCDPNCWYWFEDPTPDITPPTSTPSGGIPDWSSPGGTVCAHDLCAAGAKLDASCHPCVEKVCASKAGCCSGTWDATCVDAVYTLCDGTSSPVETSLCDFGVFASTTISGNTASFSGPIGAAQTSSSPTAYTVQLSGGSAANVFAGGNVLLSGTSVSGDVKSGGTAITLQSGASVSGTQATATNLAFPTIPTQTLSCLGVGTSQSVGTSTVTVNPGDSKRYNVDNASGTVVLSAGGNYGQIDFQANGRLVFQNAGTYRFSRLTTSTGSTVKPTFLLPASGTVKIEVCSDVDFEAGANVYTYSAITAGSCGGVATYVEGTSYAVNAKVQNGGVKYNCTVAGWCSSAAWAYGPGTGTYWTDAWTSLGACTGDTVTGTTTAPAAFALQWYTNDNDLSIGAGLLASGSLRAPYGNVRVYGSVTGLIQAKQVTAENGSSLSSTGLTGAACIAASLDAAGSAAGSCPVSRNVPELTPTFNEPCQSGLDCQVNHRCTGVDTDDSCAHPKCNTGVALSAACDPCVAMVCAADASCCSTSWSSTCVDLVKTVCDAFCADGEAYPTCAHGMCTTGAALDSQCNTCVDKVCDKPGLGYCCTSTWDQMCVTEAFRTCGDATSVPTHTQGSSLCDYAVMSDYNVYANQATIEGGDVGGGTGANAIYSSTVVGNVYGQGTFHMPSTNVSGNVSVKGSYSGTPAGTVTGTTCANSSSCVVPTQNIPTKTFTCPTGGPSQALTASSTLATGTYGDVSLTGSGNALTFQAGTYTLASLTLGDDTQIVLPEAGTVTINVCGRVVLNKRVTFVDPGGLTDSDALRFQVYSAFVNTSIASSDTITCGDSAICIDGDAASATNTTAYGVFSAPNGPGYLGSKVTLRGLLHTRQAHLHAGSKIAAGGATGYQCFISGLDTTVTLTCPTPEGHGDCVENALGFTDATCGANPDLALDVPCGDTFTVCNHGTAAAPSGSTLTFYPRDGHQFATASPDPDWAVETCTVTSSIPAGQCVTQSCPDAAARGEDLTVVVTAPAAECSTLDNWTLYEEGTVCAAGDTTFTELYEAVCPEAGMSPRWATLEWRSSISGTASITWQARVAETEMALTSESMKPLAVASVANGNVDCNLPIPNVCPVDITKQLALGHYQPATCDADGCKSYLEVQATVSATGGAATLADWEITYSCAFDE